MAWENAKARAADLGVSKSTLYPTVAAAVVAQSVRTKILFAPVYVRQTLESYAPSLELDYTIFDFGRRLDEIAIIAKVESSMIGRVGASPWTDVSGQNVKLVGQIESWLYEQIENELPK